MVILSQKIGSPLYKRRVPMNKRKARLLFSFLSISALAFLGVSQNKLQKTAQAVNNDRLAPQFVVDPFWPQPLPNKWIMGRTIGIAIDERDHLFVVHRDQDSMFMSQELGLDLGRAECCLSLIHI